MHLLRGLFGLHLLLQGFAVVRWTVENTWLRWNQKYLIRSVCRELMRIVERRRREVESTDVAREQDGRAPRLRL